MWKNGRVSVGDAWAMVRVLSEVQSADLDPSARRQSLVAALAPVLSACAGVGTRVGDLLPGAAPQVLFVTLAPNDEWRRKNLAFLDEDLVQEPLCAAVAQKAEPDCVSTFTRRQLLSDELWYDSPRYVRHHARAGVDDCLWSVRPAMRPGGFNALGFYRPVGAPPFGQRELLMLHALHCEMGLFYASDAVPAPAPGPSPLSGRENEVLARLLAGDSEKQVATRLGISPHTVHGHVKMLYRHFNVSSRAELLARFINQPAAPPAES
jgi:DNA-binding CsgD family transcriptional regulator